MKKKIISLVLLILAGMCIVLSQNGWCRMLPWNGHSPWDDVVCAATSTNNPYTPHIRHYDSINIDNSSTVINNAKIINRGENGLNDFQKKKENQGQVTNKL